MRGAAVLAVAAGLAVQGPAAQAVGIQCAPMENRMAHDDSLARDPASVGVKFGGFSVQTDMQVAEYHTGEPVLMRVVGLPHGADFSIEPPAGVDGAFLPSSGERSEDYTLSGSEPCGEGLEAMVTSGGDGRTASAAVLWSAPCVASEAEELVFTLRWFRTLNGHTVTGQTSVSLSAARGAQVCSSLDAVDDAPPACGCCSKPCSTTVSSGAFSWDLTWLVNTTNTTVDFTLSGPPDKWVGLGFTPANAPEMVGSTAVVCNIKSGSNPPSVQEYFLTSFDATTIKQVDGNGLYNTSISTSPKAVTCSFTVNMTTKTGGVPLINTTASGQAFVFASGLSEQILQKGGPFGHQANQGQIINLLKEPTPSPSPPPPPPPPPPGPACKCCDPKSMCSTTLKGSSMSWSFMWRLNPDAKPHSTIDVSFASGAETTPRWIALGFNPVPHSTSAMVNSTVVVCQPVDGSKNNASEFAISDHSAAAVKPVSDSGVSNQIVTNTKENGTTCNFTLTYGEGTAVGPLNTSLQEIIAATGNDDALFGPNMGSAGHFGAGAGCFSDAMSLETAPPTAPPTQPPTPPPPPPPPPGKCGCCANPCSSTVGGKFQVVWQIDQTHETVSFELKGPKEDSPRWIGMGFQDDPTAGDLMVGAHAVVCEPGNMSNPVQGWLLNGTDVSDILPVADAGITNYYIDYDPDSNATLCNFTLPLKSNLGTISLDRQMTIFAVGVGMHLLTAPPGQAPGHNAQEGAASSLMTFNRAPSPAPTMPPSSSCTCCTTWCNRTGTFGPQGPSYSIMWQLNETAREMYMSLETTTAAWLSIGWPTTADTMPGAYAIACLPNSAAPSVTEVILVAKDQSSFKYPTQSTLRGASVSHFTDPGTKVLSTVCSFTKSWAAAGPIPGFVPGTMDIILAVGTSDTFAIHATPGTAGGPIADRFDFRTSATGPSTGTQPLTHFQQEVWTHGMLMTVAWACVVPIGILVARFKLGSQGLWFKVHRAWQLFGLLLAFVGLAIIVSAVHEEGAPHFMVTHAKVGLAVMVAAGIQPLNSLIKRPKPADGDHVSFNRMVWEMVHKGIGYGVVFLAWFNIFLSFDLADVIQVNFANYLDIIEGVFYSGIALSVLGGIYLQVKGWYEKTAALRAVQTTTYEGF
eukprot:m.166278 g.166278  ORF g.166278 m.166278 type:complete len:1139 (+) comp12671_c0_seq1:83-3499(+)